MRRKIQTSLQSWLSSPPGARKPLLVRGARQVGKTWLIRELGRSVPSFVEINLDSRPETHALFKRSFGNPRELIQGLALHAGKPITPGSTLLFLDEIQECEEALKSLRYFFEEMPELHVIAAGSLLEFALKKLSFPVGRVEFLHVFPLSFEEFLWARGKELHAEAIRRHADLDPGTRETLMDELAQYQTIGGLPAVVKSWVETLDPAQTQDRLQELVAAYRADFNKYAGKAKVECLRLLFENIPRLLGKKFKYAHVSQEFRAQDLGLALQLLCDAGIATKCVHTSANGLPLGAEAKLAHFKVFFLDSGLALRALGLPLASVLLERSTLLENRGGLAEQFVAQEILAATPKNETPTLHYWHRESRSAAAEIDFLLVREGKILPIEVKNSATGKEKSMSLFLQEKGLKEGLRISPDGRAGSRTHPEVRGVPFYTFFVEL